MGLGILVEGVICIVMLALALLAWNAGNVALALAFAWTSGAAAAFFLALVFD